MSLAAAFSESISCSSTILVVGEEPVLRSSIAAGLNKLTNIEVLTAANLVEATAFLDTREPSLVISDIDSSGARGLEIIRELKRRHIDAPVILLTANVEARRPQLPAHPKVLVLGKTVPQEELRSRALELLGPAGTAARGPFDVVDFVQLACLSRHSVRIDVERVGGIASVTIREGEIWSAEDDQGTGPDAFKRVAFDSQGTVTCSSLVGAPGPRTITGRWEQLVLESARAFDEAKRTPDSQSESPPTLSSVPKPAEAQLPRSIAATAPSGARLPPVPAPPPIAPPRSPARAPSFDELWLRGVDALLRKDYSDAAQAFSAAAEARPDDLAVQANLVRLRQMGHIGGESSETRSAGSGRAG